MDIHFSPLALTQTLPFLPLAQGDIDYQVERRADPTLIDTVLADSAVKVIVVHGGLLAVPQGQGKFADYEAAKMRLATLPGSYVAAELSKVTGAVVMFLGTYGGTQPVVAVDITRVASGSSALFDQALTRFDWVDVRGFAPHANPREAGQATSAVCLAGWHASQQHCPVCGAPVSVVQAGWAQQCTDEQCKQLLFPRIEPAVITTIVDGRDRLLVQHNAAWKDEQLYSVSAGFVEAGENLEHACRREAFEETGVEIGEVRYLGSQPWPFPASLMVAFKAQAKTTEIHVDGSETLDAQWVTRDEYTANLITGRMVTPGKATIARYMISEWLGREL